jgi:hypothetical protein
VEWSDLRDRCHDVNRFSIYEKDSQDTLLLDEEFAEPLCGTPWASSPMMSRQKSAKKVTFCNELVTRFRQEYVDCLKLVSVHCVAHPRIDAFIHDCAHSTEYLR